MAEPRPFERFVEPWKQWVTDRRPNWSHVHVSGLLIRDGELHFSVSSTVILAQDDGCRIPYGVKSMLGGAVVVFRLPLPIAALDGLVQGLDEGEWQPNLVTGVSGPIRFNPKDGAQLQPTTDARLEPPNLGVDVSDPHSRWPRHSLELQGAPVHEWFGKDNYAKLAQLDRGLTGAGRPSLGELVGLFGSTGGYVGHIGDVWNRQTTVYLVAPTWCRIKSAQWLETRSEFVASIEIGSLCPRERVQAVLYDPLTLGLLDPISLPNQPNSPIEVVLSSAKPSDRAEVRLIFCDEEVGKERAGHGIFAASGLSAPVNRAPLEGEGDRPMPGGWRRIKALGSGGQATVFLAEKDGAFGALKEAREGVTDPVRLKRLRREIAFARRATKLPFFARVLDSSFEEEDPSFLVTELAPLGSIDDQLALFKGDTWLVLRTARNVASALEGLHRAGIVHRDIKPKNLLLYSLSRLGVADLGVAYDIGQTSITTLADPVNSGWFSPPEHDDKGRPSPAYDVFMLGRTIYYLLTGGERERDDLTTPASSVGRFVSEGEATVVNALLQQLVEPRPQARLQSMSDVIKAIDEALAGVFSSAPRQGRCTTCGKATYVKMADILLQDLKSLVVPIGNLNASYFNDKHLVLSVCPSCDGCALSLKAWAFVSAASTEEGRGDDTTDT